MCLVGWQQPLRHKLGLTFIMMCNLNTWNPNLNSLLITFGNGCLLFQPSPTGTDIPVGLPLVLWDSLMVLDLWCSFPSSSLIILWRNRQISTSLRTSWNFSPETPILLLLMSSICWQAFSTICWWGPLFFLLLWEGPSFLQGGRCPPSSVMIPSSLWAFCGKVFPSSQRPQHTTFDSFLL